MELPLSLFAEPFIVYSRILHDLVDVSFWSIFAFLLPLSTTPYPFTLPRSPHRQAIHDGSGIACNLWKFPAVQEYSHIAIGKPLKASQ